MRSAPRDLPDPEDGRSCPTSRSLHDPSHQRRPERDGQPPLRASMKRPGVMEYDFPISLIGASPSRCHPSRRLASYISVDGIVCRGYQGHSWQDRERARRWYSPRRRQGRGARSDLPRSKEPVHRERLWDFGHTPRGNEWYCSWKGFPSRRADGLNGSMSSPKPYRQVTSI